MRQRRLVYNFIGIAIALLLWEIIGRLMGEALFAPFSVVAVEYVAMLRDGQMVAELVASLRQMLVGYGAACLIGLPLGVAMGRSRLLDALLHPWLSMLVVTSVAALVPLFVVAVGTGFWFRAVIVFVASVWYVMLTVYHGARGIEPRLLDVGRSFGAPPLARFLKIILPALYPYLITALRIGLVHAIRAMVVAEMFIILGYGGLIYRAGYAMTTAPLLSLLLTLMLVGMGANAVLQRGARRLAPWYEEKIAGVSPSL
jgi:ABC-type nitrate/sulfonate/bicarbonate transport system permease component